MTERASILIFDDDIDLTMQWTQALEEENYTVICVTSADSAIAACETERFSLIICDLYVLNAKGVVESAEGLGIIAKLRQQKVGTTSTWGKNVPILAVTGSIAYRGFDAKKIATGMGATDALQKPFQPAQLVERVTELIKSAQ